MATVENSAFNSSSSGLRVMVIDDAGSMRKILRQILMQIGIHHVIEASDGREALRILRQPSAPEMDIIVSDLHMAGMDGMEFCHLLRMDKNTKACKTPVILLTGEQDRFLLDVAAQAGASQIMKKPVSPASLSEAIEKLIGYRICA